MRVYAALTISSNLSWAIIERLSQEHQFTTVTESDPNKVVPNSLGFLCLDPYGMQALFQPASRAKTLFDEDFLTPSDGIKITHICILKKGQRVATSQVRIKGVDVIELLNPILIEEMVKLLPANLHSHVWNAFSYGYKKIAPKTGDAIFKSILKMRPEEREKINRLALKLDYKPNFSRKSRSEDAAAEKDALGISLDIFGIDRKEILRSWDASDGSLGTSFLSGLKQYAGYEDDIINHDLHTLPGWQAISKAISGVVEFQNREGEKLLVINANRKPTEHALGVDLIYFHRRYEAFTFVQYKMMEKQGKNFSEFYYNPSQKSHKEELERMNALQASLDQESLSKTLEDYRISRCPIFFKLCKKLRLKMDDTSIAAGAYIPLDHWHILLKDPSTKGPKGGRQIGYNTLKKRYIGTQSFIDLMQRGFLGTQSISSKKVALFLEDALKNGHSVMYAIDERKQVSIENDEE